MVPSDTRRTTVRVGALLLLTALAFSPILEAGFLNCDDDLYVTDNPAVRGGLTRAGVAWAFGAFGYAGNWHPITWLVHMVNVDLFGLSPSGHHLVNLLLHLANAALLCLLLQRLTGTVWRSTLVAALFAVHPLHVESVAWIAELKDVLSTIFGLLALHAYGRYVRRPNAARYLPVALLLALGLLSKPMLVSLPLLLLVLDYWPLGRFRSLRAGARLVAEKAPLLLLAAGSGALTYLSQDLGGAIGLEGTAHLGIRLANVATSAAGYLAKMAWPHDLAVFYPFRVQPLTSAPVIAAFALLATLSLAALLLARRAPAVAAGWLWYLCALAPVSGLVRAGVQSMADRYTYLPLVGPFLAIVWGLTEWLPTRGRRAAGPGSAAALLVVLLSVQAFAQARVWRSSETLFRHAVAVSPESPVARINLGAALQDLGRVHEAIPHFREAARLEPGNLLPLVYLGRALVAEGSHAEALPILERAWSAAQAQQEHATLAMIAFHQGVALYSLGRLEAAVDRMLVGLQIEPRHVTARINAGLALSRLGRHAEAAVHLEEARRLDPGNPRLRAILSPAPRP